MGVFVLDACPDDPAATCVDSDTQSGGDPAISGVNLIGGTTYYIVISTWPAPDFTPFDLEIVTCPLCTDPSIAATALCDGVDENNFYVDVTTTFGSGTAYTISNSYDATTASVTVDGSTVRVGPFPNGTSVDVTVTDDGDMACDDTAAGLTEDCTPPPVGSVCADPIVVASLPYTETGGTTDGFGDDYGSGDACGSNYMGGDDIVYSYTPVADECVDITLTNTDTYVGVFVLDACPDDPAANCVDSDTQSGGDPSISGVSLTGGTTYYIVISTWPAPQTTAFDLEVISVTCPYLPPTISAMALCDGVDENNFYVDVTTTFGSGTAYTISNSYDGTTASVTVDGSTERIGPFPNGTSVDVTVTDDGDAAYSDTVTGLTEDCTPPPVGSVCEDPIVIASLPYTETGGTTAGFGDDYGSGDACGSNYMTGDDIVYSYTPGADECVDITLTNTASWVGVFVLDACPDDPAANCVDSDTQSGGDPAISGVSLTGGTTYYIVISTYPSPQTTSFDLEIATCPLCTDPSIVATALCDGVDENNFYVDVTTTFGSGTAYTISNSYDATTAPVTVDGSTVRVGPFPNGTSVDVTVTDDGDMACDDTATGLTEDCTPPPVGSVCEDPIVIASLPYTETGGTTAGFGDDYGSGDACGSFYMGGDDIVYSYTPGADECVDITLTNTASWVGVFVLDACPDDPAANCVDSDTQSGGDPAISGVSLTGGTTYYIVISTYPSPQTTSFDLEIATCPLCTDPSIVATALCDGVDENNFYVDVTTTFGSGTAYTISNSYDATTAPVTVDGSTVRVGPFPNGTSVDVTVTDDGDMACDDTATGLTEDCTPPPVGSVCEDPIVVASLPYTETGGTTNGFGDDYGSGDACGSFYMGGDDIVYSYTPGADECVDITLTNTASWVGVFVLDACPDDPAANCVDSDTQSGGDPAISGVSLTGGTTYYIVISTYPSPQTTAFDLEIATCTPPPVGSVCADPIVVASLPYTETGGTTNGFGDDYGSADACGNNYMGGDDIVYSYTPGADECVDITLTNTDTYVGVFVLDACPDDPAANCVDSDTQSGGNPAISGVNLTGGTTYFIVISTWPVPDFTPFDLEIVNCATCLRIVDVDPTTDVITVQNFGATTVDVSNHQFCSLFSYTTLGSLTVDAGSLNLAPGATVTLSGFALTDAGADLGLYVPGATFSNPDDMLDFIQWGSAGNGRESVAVTKGIWTAGDYVDMTTVWQPPFVYIGADCTENGVSFWTGNDCTGAIGGSNLPGSACDDGDPNTGNDVYQADCSCAGEVIDCLGVPGGTATVGSACDDGDPNTGNDVYQADCSCAGEVIDCLGVPGGTATVGSACDDGDPNTGNDVYQADCSCAGEVIDCLGVPGGTATVGSACDDGDPNTGNDVYQADCSCAGEVIDCLGVPGGTATVGSACDDGDPNTGNDVYQADCSCAGEVIDCLGVPGGTATIGSACDDGDPNTVGDVYQADCSCAGQVEDCLGVPGGTATIGSACDDGDPNTGNDVYQADCSCAGEVIDCLGVPGGTATVGSACDDGDPNTGNDVYQADCSCAGEVIDCLGVPGGTATVGSACDDGDPNTGNDVYQADCSCAGEVIDCLGVPGGTATVGSACDDGDPNTGNDVYQADCSCAGEVIDCLGVPGGTATVGSACDDGDPNTGNDVYQADCSCAGEVIDCLGVPGGTATVGSACDDGDPNTGNDVYQADCSCAGEVIDCNGVIGGPDLPGSTCDDGDPNTGNDVYQADCSCAGELIDCNGIPGGPDVPGAACDDGDPLTTGDVLQADCSCAGVICPDGDDDNDGVCNSVDACPGFDDNLDADADGVPDDCDICTGDDASGDTDADGVCDDIDACPGFDDNLDADADGVPDDCDICTGDDASGDTDADGICDDTDTCPIVAGQIGDACDDGDANTENDALDANCVCVGTPIAFACPVATTPASGTQSLCDAGIPDLTPTGTGLVISDTEGTLDTGDADDDGVEWFTDSGFTMPYDGSALTSNVGCDVAIYRLYAALRCDSEKDGFFNDANDSYEAAGFITVEVYPAPQAPSIVANDATCTYSYVPACPTDVFSPGAIADEEPGYAGETETVSVTNTGGCTAVFSVVKPACVACSLPLITVVSSTQGGAASPYYYNGLVLEVSGGVTPYSISWNNTGYVRYSIRQNLNGTLTINIIYATSADVDLTVTDAFGCSVGYSSTGALSEPLQIVNYNVTATSGSGISDGGVDISVSGGDGNYTYDWSSTVDPSFNETSQDVSNVPSGWYTVLVTDGTGATVLGTYWVPSTGGGSTGGGFTRNKTAFDDAQTLTAFPNPFSSATTVEFSVAQTGKTKVGIYNVDGKQIATLFDGTANDKDVYALTFNAADLPAGMYIVKVSSETGDARYTKLILLK